jgi:hypothetical protein
MTREDDPGKPLVEGDDADDAMSALLKRSLDTKTATPPATDEFLRGVQGRIRARSRGKFYADGWSTSSQRASYAVIALVMLLVVALAYFVLGPTGMSAP